MNELLTATETEIVTMFADGSTAVEIMSELGIGRDTLGTHRANIHRKLGAKTTAHFVALAYHKGILRVPGLVYG